MRCFLPYFPACLAGMYTAGSFNRQLTSKVHFPVVLLAQSCNKIFLPQVLAHSASAPEMSPQITSWDDLAFVSEEVDSESDTFKYTSFAVLENTETFYYGELRVPKADLSLEQIKAALRPVPDPDIFLPWPTSETNVRMAPEALPANIYIKRRDWEIYSYLKKRGLEKQLFNSLVAEAEVLEELSKYPHPNLIHYHGCRVTRGHLVGLVLEKHPRDLQTHIQSGFEIEDKEEFMCALGSAIQHLHALGWAHNDLNPTNVLVSETGEPILIDFEGCQKFGTNLKHIRGTKEWIEGTIGDYDTSEPQHDIFAIDRIQAWLEDPRSIKAER